MKKGERNCKELNEIGEIHWYIYILFRTLVLTHPTFCGNSKENVADTLPFLFFLFFGGKETFVQHFTSRCNVLSFTEIELLHSIAYDFKQFVKTVRCRD